MAKPEREFIEPAYRVVPDEWNAVTERVIGCAMEVHSSLGPGLIERIYEDAMAHELGLHGLAFTRQQSFRVRYKGVELSEQRLDLVVENLVVVELKSVESISDTHLAQLVSYLRTTDLPLGLLINFNTARLAKGLHRRLHSGCSRFPPAPTRTLPPPLRSSDPSATSAF